MAPSLETTSLAAGSGKATQLTMLVDGVADPVDARIVADSLVGSVHQNYLKVLIDSVLVNPVRVKHTEAGALAANALLGNAAQVAGGLQLGDTSVHGLAINNTLQE